MGTQTVSIQITAKDGASAVFTKLGSTAKSALAGLSTAGKSAAGGLKEVGSAGTAAGSGLGKLNAESSKAAGNLNKTGAAAEKAGSGVKSLGDKATATGAALGTLVAGLAKVGAAAETQRRQIDGIQKAYGEAADEMLEFADAVQASTKFSNEDAREAAQIAATLAQNYGFTTEEVQKLIDVSADLASIKGIDLADAVQRTSAAMRGEAESAEFLGLTLNQQAIDREGLTLKMSNEEAAHFRLNALLEQAAYAEGAAGEAAATAAGQSAQFANKIQDMTVQVGEMLGPLAGTASSMADFSLALTLGGAAVGKFIGGLSGAGGKLASFVGAINPIGVAITAAAVAGGVLVHSLQEQMAASQAAEDSYVNLASAIDQVSDAAARSNLRDAMVVQSSETQGAEGFFRNLGSTIAGTSRNLDEYTISGQEAAEINNLLATGAATAADDVSHFATEAVGLKANLDGGNLTVEQMAHTLEGLNDVFAYTGNGAEEVQDEVMRLVDSFIAGDITADALGSGIDRVTADVGAYADALVPAIEGTARLAATQEELDAALASQRGYEATVRGLEQAGRRYEALADSIREAEEAAMAPALASGQGFGLSLDDRAREEIAAYGEELAAAAEEAEAFQEHQREVAATLRGELVPAVEGASNGFDGMIQPGEDVLDTLARIAPQVGNVGGSFLQFADNLNDAQQALDGVLGMFAAIDNLGAGADKANDIATQLIGEPGVWSTLDDLVTNAAISQETYNSALTAGLDIQANNVAIQEDLNAIRANQLPLLDSQVTKLAAYVDGLTEASAAEQQQALYLMDSANQAKVASAYSTAYAASLGEIPSDVATTIIADAAQADPILGDILESFGLIEVGADGTVTVNFPNKATLDDVTAAIDNLTESQIEIFIAMSGGDEAAADAAGLRDNLEEIDGRTATATANVEGGGTEAITEADTALDNLDGRTATATANVEGTGTEEIKQTDVALDTIDGRTATATVKVDVDDSALSAALASGAGFGAGMDTNAVKIPVEADTSSFDASVANLTTNKVVKVKVEADTASFDSSVSGLTTSKSVTVDVDADMTGFSNALNALDSDRSVVIDIKVNDNATSVVDNALSSVESFDGKSVTATLNATDSATQIVVDAHNQADAFAQATYNATLTATDSATQIIVDAHNQGDAFATSYNGTLTVTDSASSVISSAQSAASAFATTYSASLEAVDNASGVISSVAAALAALDGTTATTYVETVQLGTLPAKELGGQVRDMPTARLGRNILVGEAGPEVVTLPFGSMVKPHGAEGSNDQFKAPDLTPEVDMAKAYRRGGDSAKAFYKGLYDEAKSELRSARSEIGDTRFDTKDDARAAIRDYMEMQRQTTELMHKINDAAEYDRRQRERLRREARAESERTVRETKEVADRVVETMGTAGEAAGAEFTQELSDSADAGSVIDQVMKLKDEFIDTMKASAGATGDVTSEVESFNEEIANIVGGMQDVDKSGEKALGEVTDSFEDVTDGAEDMGEAVGEGLGEGVTEGADDATSALANVVDMMDRVGGQSVDPNVGLDTSRASQGLNEVGNALSRINSMNATADVRADVDDSEWDSFLRDVESHGQMGVTIVAHVKERREEKALGGQVSIERDVPTAATGRVVTVGEAGEESVVLPYGAMVIPHGAAQARGRADAAVGGSMNIYGNITVVAATPDVHAAIASSLMTMQRD